MGADFYLIKDLIEDSIDKFSDYGNGRSVPYIEIRPIIDAMALYVEKNIAVKIINNKGETISTYQIQPLKKVNNTNAIEYKLGTFKLLVAEVTSYGFVKLKDLDLRKLNKLIDWLVGNHSDELNYAANHQSIKARNISFIQYSIEDFVSDIEKAKIKSELRKIITAAVRTFENNRSIKIKNVDVPNIFHVIKYASNLRKEIEYDYTAQILLSETQKENILKYIKSQEFNTDNFSIDSLEDPLDKNSKSIADECFKYECVRFDSYKTTGSNSDSDNLRQKIEDSIYNNITTKDKKVFYVPIHLNGAAWMAIYRIIPEIDSEIDYLSFYRNKISIIASQVRNEAIKSFFSLIRSKVEEAFTSAKSSEVENQVVELNNYMKLLSTFFSYYIPVFPNIQSNELDFYSYLNRLVNPNYEFRFIMNRIWENEIDYDNIPIPEFSERLKINLNSVYLKYAVAKEKEKRKALVSNATHALKTELETSLIPLGKMITDRLKSYSISEDDKLNASLLEDSIKRFYSLTGLSNLLNKMIDVQTMIKSGKKDKLFAATKTTLSISDHLLVYKTLKKKTKLRLTPQTNPDLEIHIYDIWLGSDLLTTFLNMIFQNAEEHAKPEINEDKILNVNKGKNYLEFKNRTWYEKVKIDPDSLTGNLLLFDEMINNSDQMGMTIDSCNHEFKITLWTK